MFELDTEFVNEEFYAETVSGNKIDELWANGWRHFGTHFFRYNFGVYGLDIRPVIPLRIRLADFSLSKSHRRILKKNADLETVIRPIEISRETEALFDRHKLRFKQGIPDSIFDFVSRQPASQPCEAFEVSVYENESMIASSFFDFGEIAISGIYAMFEPAKRRRSLGTFTMLKEIEFAVRIGKAFYYQGYSYEGESFYDYKKRFRGTEMYDWKGKWKSFAESK